MFSEYLRGGVRFVETRVVQRGLPVHVLRVHIRSGIDEQLCNRSVIGVRRCVKRCRAPMFVAVVTAHVGTSLN